MRTFAAALLTLAALIGAASPATAAVIRPDVEAVAAIPACRGNKPGICHDQPGW